MAGTDSGGLTDATFWDARWTTAHDSRPPDHRRLTRRYQYAALDRALRSVLPSGPLTFVELGGAQARWMVYFHHTFGYRVHGCDYSAVGCELARRRLAEAGVPGTVEEADFFRLRGAYDVVLSAGSSSTSTTRPRWWRPSRGSCVRAVIW